MKSFDGGDPVWSSALDAWLVTRYQDVVAILKDTRFSALSGRAPDPNASIGTACPHHAAMRRQFAAFLKQRHSWIIQCFETETARIADTFQNTAPRDLQEDFIQPACHRIALSIMSVDEAHADALVQAAHTVFRFTDDPSPSHQANDATLVLSRYFLHQLGDDHVLVAPCIQLFVGVCASLPLLLGNVLFYLLSHPQEKAAFQNVEMDRDIMLEELLRLAGPSVVIFRLATSDAIIGEHTFRCGERVALALSSANRDPLIFPDPPTLHFLRETNHHLSFGLGAHACLGTPFIREACVIVLLTILNRWPSLAMSHEDIRWGGSAAIYGITALPVQHDRGDSK